MVLPVNEVIVIDTYTSYINAGGNFKFLKQLIPSNTIIIIDHNKSIATKQDIPTIDEKIANHLSSKLFLEYIKKNNTTQLRVLKSRGYKGPNIITGWMR